MLLWRFCYCLLLVLFFNLVLLASFMPFAVSVLVGFLLIAFYIFFNILPCRAKDANARLKILRGGNELIFASLFSSTAEFVFYIVVLVAKIPFSTAILITNAVVSALLIFLMHINGLIRLFVFSSQLGLLRRILLLFLWWVPIVNIILLYQFVSISGTEYQFTLEKSKLNTDRKSEKLCQTKYPLLMVHGVFFRDWKIKNYWGRIPNELTANGATIYYGEHQSAASVEKSGEELKNTILKIVEETGCEKVNIIAHSKGGLDARNAISCHGMDKYTASLTTIATPHRGCNHVRILTEKISQNALASIGKKYEALYKKLGDDSPDFFGGLEVLTDTECERLNALMPDSPDVHYQSVGSKMRSAGGAIFPLNLGYELIKRLGGGDNDGLVSVSSMAWGNFLGIISPKGSWGISHGDTIDLTGKNIDGFDVCEFYVDLVHNLKLKGF
ncbi:MAG: triacylglycerol lipase [Clostridiales bacterium]|nr:triacylglycerol lipase [Clostridiales bacterium]